MTPQILRVLESASLFFGYSLLGHKSDASSSASNLSCKRAIRPQLVFALYERLPPTWCGPIRPNGIKAAGRFPKEHGI